MRCWKNALKIADVPMRYWDTSAILPLVADEPARERLLKLYEEDSQIVAWWGTPVELASAVARREREGAICTEDADAALRAARRLAAAWHEIIPGDMIRRTAERLLRVHALRAADSLQLSAALIAANHDPATLEMVCFDGRLTAAARREGFTVIDS
jgi:predicted nucleic acid-binding protein